MIGNRKGFRNQIGASVPSGEPPDRTSFLPAWVIPFGSFLVACVGLLGRELPWWISAVIVSYVIIVAVLALLPISIWLWKKAKSVRSCRALARHYRPELRHFVAMLIPNLEESRPETVYCTWRNTETQDQGRQTIRPDASHLRTLRSWLDSIAKQLTLSNIRDFENICKELAELVNQYCRLCEQAHREIESLALNGNLDENRLRQLKQEWNNTKDRHNHFINGWEVVAKRINQDAGRRVCYENYGLLKTIG